MRENEVCDNPNYLHKIAIVGGEGIRKADPVASLINEHVNLDKMYP